MLAKRVRTTLAKPSLSTVMPQSPLMLMLALLGEEGEREKSGHETVVCAFLSVGLCKLSPYAPASNGKAVIQNKREALASTEFRTTSRPAQALGPALAKKRRDMGAPRPSCVQNFVACKA